MAADPPIASFRRALEEGRYFEAHEILEAFWVSHRGEDREFYKGLIQAAVALHHAAHGNAAGAGAVARRARGYLRPYAPRHRGIDVLALLERLSGLAA